MVYVVRYKPLKLDDYVYPLEGQLLGAVLSLASTIFVPLYFMYSLMKAPGVKIKEVGKERGLKSMNATNDIS